jgi:hypothetical protein
LIPILMGGMADGPPNAAVARPPVWSQETGRF